jgi:arsenate reductase
MLDLDSLSPDQQLALKIAAHNLQDQFTGTFSIETIELFLQTSYDRFADRAKFTNFQPLMAERFARQRLTALGEFP